MVMGDDRGLFTREISEGSRSRTPKDNFANRNIFRKRAKEIFDPLGIAEGNMFIPRDDVDPKVQNGITIQELVEESVGGRRCSNIPLR